LVRGTGARSARASSTQLVATTVAFTTVAGRVSHAGGFESSPERSSAPPSRETTSSRAYQRRSDPKHHRAGDEPQAPRPTAVASTPSTGRSSDLTRRPRSPLPAGSCRPARRRRKMHTADGSSRASCTLPSAALPTPPSSSPQASATLPKGAQGAVDAAPMPPTAITSPKAARGSRNIPPGRRGSPRVSRCASRTSQVSSNGWCGG
jgi:hypothetical protein